MESITKFVPLTLCDDSEDTLQRLPCPQHRGSLCTDVRLRPTDRLTIRLRACAVEEPAASHQTAFRRRFGFSDEFGAWELSPSAIIRKR